MLVVKGIQCHTVSPFTAIRSEDSNIMCCGPCDPWQGTNRRMALRHLQKDVWPETLGMKLNAGCISTL